MTQSPCFNEKTRTDCPKRCVGCKSSCAEWAKWEIIHARERAEINRKKRHSMEADTVLMLQGKRTRLSNQAKREREGRR